MATRDPYFEGTMPERQALAWAAAVRRQLQRWELLVAKHTLMGLEPNLTPPPEFPTTMTTGEYWEGETERHLLLNSIHNLLKARRLMKHPPDLDPTVAKEVTETRDLNEHWDENMPVFQVSPRTSKPKRASGKSFADRNPRHGPYCWWAWDSQRGPLVSPNVAATQIHELVEATITAVVLVQPDMAGVVADAAPRPWKAPLRAGDWWWPELG
jgi:hypothetical protein